MQNLWHSTSHIYPQPMKVHCIQSLLKKLFLYSSHLTLSRSTKLSFQYFCDCIVITRFWACTKVSKCLYGNNGECIHTGHLNNTHVDISRNWLFVDMNTSTYWMHLINNTIIYIKMNVIYHLLWLVDSPTTQAVNFPPFCRCGFVDKRGRWDSL